MNPELAPAGWRPLFSDYLYLGFNNALAFSPTETMPLVVGEVHDGDSGADLARDSRARDREGRQHPFLTATGRST